MISHRQAAILRVLRDPEHSDLDLEFVGVPCSEGPNV